MKAVRAWPFNLNIFVILAVIITIFCGLIFVLILQAYRQAANDPQIQISEDMARYLAEGNDLMTIMPPREVDVAKSSVWFLSVYDATGSAVSSNAVINGQMPVLPAGVLEHAKRKGQNRVTWEPEKGVRIATVVTAYDGGYVLAGRSLKETDSRIMMLGEKVVLGWVIALVLTFAGTQLLLPKKLHN